VQEAVEAAATVASELGLRVEEPVVLRDLTNVLVHLAPESVVARVHVTYARRGPARLERELALAAALHGAGLPVARPTIHLPPGPYERNGFLVTLWDYVEHDVDVELDAREAGRSLRRIHDALADTDAQGLDHFARLDEIEHLVEALAFGGGELEAFRRGAEAARRVVDRIDAPLQPIHGDAHHGNLLRTASGALWGDFENACLGPRELDLVCNEIRARAQGRTAADDDFLAGYGEHDAELVTQLIPVHALFLAAWTFALAERRPEVRTHAEQRLRWVVEGFAL
jgi:aminoglycoside phosphotransferase (APT) family kinase protein